jgi:hypothetical protein
VTDTTVPEFDTVEDILEQANAAPYHTILEVWREVLKPAKEERWARITPQWANRIITTYNGLSFADMREFRDRYFDKIAELETILLGEIEGDDECLNLTKPEEDVEANSHHYMNILIDWQKTFLGWELAWETASPSAAIELAAISEVHRMFFDPNGLTALLDQIKFEFTDADRDLLASELEAMRDSQED